MGKRQKLIGFATSEAATNLFARYLHKLNLIHPGFNVNHRFFSSLERAKERFEFAFAGKDKILGLLVNQERFREKLCYGKSKDETSIRDAVSNYFILKEAIEKEITAYEKNEEK